ncbi:T9SS type A sorting domain-containing protein [Flavivirga algicola]|uniref:T9SS type A sorting domain-containing protein n=1 Tax=Flavivirga algicola TaxID=2729136 RepID=A0ABX1RW12_9FLAO|nr:M64 family metallopeptidase [Flavivirga algicola]NMH87752.1 T9SS type A sorting domain-containing protein [Flavivirga algicola]
MKYFLMYIVCFLNIGLTAAQTFDMDTIKFSGDSDKRINLVILSEGYQTTELTQFITDATNLTNDMFSQSPFLEYAEYFNVYAIKVPSNESGADHPATATDVTEPVTPEVYKDTYFNATFDAFNFHRFLFYGINYTDAIPAETKIRSVLADNFPTYDQALILVNTDIYGGTGGEFPIASTSANDIAIHELGHSLFDLKDEYYAGDVFVGEAINMTQESNPSLVKWKNWIGINGIGIYQHSGTPIAATWYRPHQSCKMRYLGVPFCSVCKEGMIEKIHSLVSPIASYMPISNTVSNPSFPIDFNLNLIKPIPNTLESSWTLNTANFATNIDNVSVLETDLNAGLNNLTVVVTDNTALLKVNNHETIHVYMVTWTIDNTSLGVKDIEADSNNLSITMYPNPTNTIANFKIESEKDAYLKMDITSLDGKKLKTVSASNYEIQQIDISNLSQGIYIVNFYTNNALVASKKLVKQ